ncbi:MAG: GGDEF domain-containing protein [Peptococcaceae bacterium]
MTGLLNASKRFSDIVIRYGGDEFLLIFMDGEEQGLLKWQERLNRNLARWNAENELINCDLSLSIGYSIYDEQKDIETVIKEADMKMYRNKATKKNNKEI